MTEIQTNFRSEDMLGASKVTATPATIAKSVAPRAFFPPKPIVEEAPKFEDIPEADVEVDEEVA